MSHSENVQEMVMLPTVMSSVSQGFIDGFAAVSELIQAAKQEHATWPKARCLAILKDCHRVFRHHSETVYGESIPTEFEAAFSFWVDSFAKQLLPRTTDSIVVMHARIRQVDWQASSMVSLLTAAQALGDMYPVDAELEQ